MRLNYLVSASQCLTQSLNEMYKLLQRDPIDCCPDEIALHPDCHWLSLCHIMNQEGY